VTHLTYHSALVSYHILYKRDLVLRVEDAWRSGTRPMVVVNTWKAIYSPCNRAIVVVGILINMRLINILYPSVSPVNDSSEKR
jgi:hypothetical protein